MLYPNLNSVENKYHYHYYNTKDSVKKIKIQKMKNNSKFLSILSYLFQL